MAPVQGMKFTKADLAFVDAAIAMQKAALIKAEGPSIDASNPAACDPVDVAAAVVAVAVLAYHLYNSCMIGAANAEVLAAQKLDLRPTVSLDKMLAARAIAAKQLGVQ